VAATWVDRYKVGRYRVFRWRYELSLAQKFGLALGMACVTGLMAQLRIPLPWTPVPITGQVLAVLLAGVLLGRWWGGISQALYAGLGAAGIPWFAGWSGGYAILAGPTGGYIIGFILAALFLGHFSDKYIRARDFLPMLGLMLFANFFLIHGLGLLHLGLWLQLVEGKAFTLWQLIWMGTIPFIGGDVTKAIIAAVIAKGITPKQAFNGEVDAGKVKGWRIP